MSVFVQASASCSKSLRLVLSGIAIVGVGALVLSGCTPTNGGHDRGPTKNLVLKIGTLLPETGKFAFLGPPTEGGVALAVKEVNGANMGITIDVTYGDSGDLDNKAYATTLPNLLSEGVTAIIGAASSAVSKLVIDQITGEGLIELSPANTSPDFTTWDDDNLYWRTAPSDLLQGEVLGNLIAADGASTLGIIAINDAYGTGLQKVTDKTFTDAGGKVVATEFYNTGDTTFTSQISSVMAQKPDAIALISFNEALTIIPALKAAGYNTSKLYLVDGNLKQYGDKLPTGVLTGAKGMTSGSVLSNDFQMRVQAAYSEANNGKSMGDIYSYTAESYDAVILIALAALAANSVKGADIATKLQEVSGGSGSGEKATDFKSAAAIIDDGGVVDYDGYSGGIKFDNVGDPTEATIGIFQYDETNHFSRVN